MAQIPAVQWLSYQTELENEKQIHTAFPLVQDMRLLGSRQTESVSSYLHQYLIYHSDKTNFWRHDIPRGRLKGFKDLHHS